MNTALAERQDTAPVTERNPRALKPATTPSAMLAQAVASGAPFEVVQGLMAMLKETRAEEQKMAFDAALSAAKAEIPIILKNRTVGYDHKDGSGKTSYRHEDLGQIAKTVDPILSKHGLSYRFRTTSEANQPIAVTCIVAHRDGYSEENTLMAGRDESGKKLFFRYYDPRILRAYLPSCTSTELAEFFGPVGRFLLEGRDGQLVMYERGGRPLRVIEAKSS